MTFQNIKVGGRDAVVSDTSIDYQQLLAAFLEQVRRVKATYDPALVDALHSLASDLAGEFSEAFPGADPDLVCRVTLVLCSKVIGPLHMHGMNPVDIVNTSSLAAVMYAGHIERTEASA